MVLGISGTKMVVDESETSWSMRNPTKKSLQQHTLSFKNWRGSNEGNAFDAEAANYCLNIDQKLISPRMPESSKVDAAAVKVQKVYKSYRTRRKLADSAVVAEELWWKALDFASLKLTSVSFFKEEKQETAVSRWARARKRVARVGKGLSKDGKAQKLALRHWLEAIDPRHRYGHNLHIYYEVWFGSESTQPFFYWLDVGDGKEVNLPNCPRSRVQQQCIKYLGPKEREAYEVIVDGGKLVYKQTGLSVNAIEGYKLIFVLCTSRNLYIGQKEKGRFQHSSFLAGGATSSAGRLVAKDGILQAIWPYSGHYLPTEDNFKDFITFLTQNHVDLSNVKRCSVDDDVCPPSSLEEPNISEALTQIEKPQTPRFKWSTGAGPRIGCVRDYPVHLQSKALEQVNLSPRVPLSPVTNMGPIPSPRPSPEMRLSPRLSFMGFPIPTRVVKLSLPPPPP